MTEIVVAPNINGDDELLDTGYCQFRPAATFWSGTEWVIRAWSPKRFFVDGEVTVDLDAHVSVPWEIYLEIQDGRGEVVTINEFRIVPSSGTPLNWATLTLTNGATDDPVSVPLYESRLAAVEAGLLAVSGGASDLDSISDMSAQGRTLNAQTSYADMRSTMGAASAATVTTIQTDLDAAEADILTVDAAVTAAQGDADAASALAATKASIAGDLGGTAAAPVVEAVRGVDVASTAPTAGQVLTATSGTAAEWAAAQAPTDVVPTRKYTGSAWPSLSLPIGYTGRVDWDSLGDPAAPAPAAARDDDLWLRDPAGA